MNELDTFGALNDQFVSQPQTIRGLDANAMNTTGSNIASTFSPQAQDRAQNQFGTNGQRQGIMNLDTPLESNAFIGAKVDAENKGESTFTVSGKTFNVK